MLMLVQWLAPGVEDGQAPNLRAQMLGVPGDVLERLGDRAKEQPIEQTRVLERQRPEVVWQGKDDMDVGRVEHLALPGCKPRGLGGAMAFGAATVPARVVCLFFVPTVVALGDMPPEGGSAAQGDGPQGPVLLAREGVPIAGQKGGAMLAHHIGDFKLRATCGLSQIMGSWPLLVIYLCGISDDSSLLYLMRPYTCL